MHRQSYVASDTEGVVKQSKERLLTLTESLNEKVIEGLQRMELPGGCPALASDQ